MKTTRQYNYSLPIPPHIPPAVVIAVLYTFLPFMTTHLTMTSFTEQLPHPSQVRDDPFFGPWDDTFRCFQASDFVTLAPRMTKTLTYQVLFQAIRDGVRSRAIATAGVTIRSEYTVRPRPGPTSPARSDSTGSSVTVVGEEYELNEDMEIEANSLLMRFVADRAIEAHQHIINTIMEQLTKTYFGVPFLIPWESDGHGTWQRIAL